jgi:hypothetical protein
MEAELHSEVRGPRRNVRTLDGIHP